MDEVRKKSLKEVLPKKGLELAGKKANPGRRTRIETAPELDMASFSQSAKPPKDYYETRRRPRMSYFIWLCLALILLVGGYYLSTAFALVTVKITPKQLPITIAGTFEATRAPAEGIEFSVIKLEETATKEVPASGQAKVETKAVGTVTITNNYSTASQKLVAGTRLESADGLIFKLDSTITVPGQTKKGTTITPGSIEVRVTASEVGDKYNLGTASFKIVGFKGSPRYDKFSAQTKTPLAGGKQGLVGIVKDADRAKVVASLETELKDRVAKKAQLQIPKDFIIFTDGVMTSFSDDLIAGTASSTVTISTKVTMIALLFNVKNLSQYFAEKQLKDESVEGIRLFDPSSLVFKLQNKDKFDFAKTNKISFTLNGKANLVWTVDTVGLKTKLLNTAIKDKDQIFAGYPAVYRAEATVRPPWILSFPGNENKINIKLIMP
jgi:hypothetical protein